MNSLPAWLSAGAAIALALMAFATVLGKPFKKINSSVSRLEERLDRIDTEMQTLARNQNAIAGMLRTVCSSEINVVADKILQYPRIDSN